MGKMITCFFKTFLIFFILTLLFPFSSFSEDKALVIDANALFKANCKTCHTIGKGVVVGPDLKDFHTRQTLEWALPWIRSSQTVIRSGDDYAVSLYKEYNDVEMPDQTLNDDEITAIYNYIKEESAKVPATAGVGLEGEGLTKADDSGDMYLIILIVILLILSVVLNKVVSTLNALVREKQGLSQDTRTDVGKFQDLLIQNKPIVTIAVIIGLIFGMREGIQALSNLGIQHKYAPEQPINFPHDKHAGEMKIDCKYCHSGADKSKNAGIPSANVCMNCHSVIKKDAPEIQKLYSAIKNNQPIQWIKVHNLPDHVYFNHSQHVKVGGIECQKCHGPVEEMKVIEKHEAITMGFCINCHRETAVKFTENAYYDDKFEELHEDLKNKKIDMVTVKDIGGTECQKCHY
ncbi:c-type cytochrome [Bacteroidales bacterium AH-315-N07]|nr:c-type cytochrome [Bacteroidales bacterium AH-315-N07]